MISGKKADYIGVIDLGTTSIRFITFNLAGEVLSESFQAIKQFYPKPGWVEEDPVEIWETTQSVIAKSIKSSGIDPNHILALGISNQRESTLIWDRQSGKPLSNLIVWQDRRTSDRCAELKKHGFEEVIKQKTGLTIDPYFSATKLEWLLKNNETPIKKAETGNLLFGTVDSWIIFNITGQHLTDYSNASRTMLFNIINLTWDEELLDIFNIPLNVLPRAIPSFGNAIYGYTHDNSVFKRKIPICSVFGDQQAALFGQKCFSEGDIKCTFGTGSFLIMNTGRRKISSKNNLLTTIFFGSNNNEVYYALEGSIYNTGSILQWLKEELGIINSYDEIEILASGVNYQDNLFLVPAFTGLGAPFWDPYARGLIIGLTRASGKKQIIRTALESMALSTCDVLLAMERDSKIKFIQMKIDGGVSQNRLFCKILADITGIKIIKYDLKEFTALGSMYGAGIGIGIWDGPDEIKDERTPDEYLPEIGNDLREKLYRNWSRAILLSRNWAKECE
ncbi:MAG: glycerol kinase GlpK [Actinobacteria bacterium]|nr:glycerol kinase GlpK [Actinomycetota bacterium]